MVERLKVAAEVIKESFKHPLTTSFITVNDGAVSVTRDDSSNSQEATATH